MKYLSVCSGIEAATQAWHPLGWEPVAYSEIEAFPSAVLAHHYPNVPNWGDMTKFKEWPDAKINVLVGGTPCQSFSVAGLRKGLADPRGNLTLTYLAIADRYRPAWLAWENVPGVLSTDEGGGFGSILGALAKLGYGFAYRVLDAQFVRTRRFPRAVPQRRRRVFLIAHLGDWRRAAAVLFDPESLSGNPPPRREAGEGVAGSIAACSFVGGAGGRPEGAAAGHFIPEQAAPLGACHRGLRDDLDSGAFIPEVSNPLTHRMHKGINTTLDEGQTAIPVAFATQQTPKGFTDVCPTLQVPSKSGGGQPHAVATPMAVRRLTPRECERLMGFPDDYTRIPWRGKPAEDCPDGPRYKALGNSMAVNCMEWIGDRITMVSEVE